MRIWRRSGTCKECDLTPHGCTNLSIVQGALDRHFGASGEMVGDDREAEVRIRIRRRDDEEDNTIALTRVFIPL